MRPTLLLPAFVSLLALVSPASSFAADLSKLNIVELAENDAPADLAALPALVKAMRARPMTTDTPVPVFRLSNLDFLGAKRREKLDLYIAHGPERQDRPAVLFIHGGGFTGGDKAEYRSASVSADMARAGYVVVSCNYVLGSKTTPGVWPQNIHDCRQAVRWMRQHARELGINPDKIAVAGGSAGGYLALMVGLSDDRTGPGGDPQAKFPAKVAGVIDMYGVTDFSKHGKGAAAGMDPEAEKSLLPANNITPSNPPVLILHGTADTTVALDQSEMIATALRSGKVDSEFIVVTGAPHTFDLHPKGTGWKSTRVSFDATGKEHVETRVNASAELTDATIAFLARTIGR